ncbi:glycogen/starch/alpha-glucan phosphorylase [Pelosinus sp. sgz500959]|uniref:glycogen/starch/alpha-glucan phosphorylase n=1 Tax=Pelosinus sp. sgz500959 TaxID=3242472 RepID=UPI0036712C55
MKLNKELFKDQFLEKLMTMHVKSLEETSNAERYRTLSSLVRDYISKKWIASDQHYQQEGSKQVYYLSIEFLIGRMLGMNLLNLGIYDLCKEALAELGISLDVLEKAEEDPGLGNGGLGRLAACYLDSMAAESLPGHGCSLRYRYGFFEQKIVNGYQVEVPDNWLDQGFPWEFKRSDQTVSVNFGGNIRVVSNDKLRYLHENYDTVFAVPYDVPILGYKNDTINTLRIWSAEASEENFICSTADMLDCVTSMEYTKTVESLSSVLYPDDSAYEGKVLRLKQHYFLVSASLQSIIKNYKQRALPLDHLADYIAIHINDTHPALAIPEMMRILIDVEEMGWDEAWKITVNIFSYTNHTVLPEALEKWPIDMIQNLLPRLYLIINEMNERFCHELWNRYPGDWDKIRSMAIISDHTIHMANLAIVGSHSVNGVAQIHTEILKTRVMNQFHQFYPTRFNNKTNGVAHRRWLLKINPRLSSLLNESIGSSWISHPCDLLKILKYADDHVFQEKLARIKRYNKSRLAEHIRDVQGIRIDVDSIFDSHIKRIHGYKRQTMNVFHIMHLYNLLRENPDLDIIPRTFIFGGKAAPGYHLAKQTIKLINTLATVINKDKSIRDKIKVVFIENYNVTMAELIIPATNVSEQIPTASQEACGTGNMKFMMNGAITIGTLDGANIEIRNVVGDNNIVFFGLTANEVLELHEHGGYNPWDVYNKDERIKTVLDQLINGFFPVGTDEFKSLFESFLYHNDQFFVLKDFASYADAQLRLDQQYRNRNQWLSMCVHNIAHSGKFSGDRTFTEYAMDVWNMNPTISPQCYCSNDDKFTSRLHGCAFTSKLQQTISSNNIHVPH